MAGTLRRYVTVEDQDGNPVQFGPADQVPDWAAAKITNPAAWAEVDSAEGIDGDQNRPAAPKRRGRAPKAVDDGPGDEN